MCSHLMHMKTAPCRSSILQQEVSFIAVFQGVVQSAPRQWMFIYAVFTLSDLKTLESAMPVCGSPDFLW